MRSLWLINASLIIIFIAMYMTGNIIANHSFIAVLLFSIFIGNTIRNLYHDAIPAAVIAASILTRLSASLPTPVTYAIPGNTSPLPDL